MPDHRRHRGPHPEDRRLFAPDQVSALQMATEELSWLLDRGYALASSLKLVGDRRQLAARQRIAVSRCACGEQQRRERIARRRPPAALAGEPLWIDGYNVLTTLEAALAGGVILRGRDGCLRDMASMHGSYRKVAETAPAIELAGEVLAEWRVAACRWLFDRAVSNSGRLRELMLDAARRRAWNWTVELVPDPDPLLAKASACVATADSDVLNQTAGWAPLVGFAVATRIPQAWVVDLAPGVSLIGFPEHSDPSR